MAKKQNVTGAEFQIGDSVQLKSGGPEMTVGSYNLDYQTDVVIGYRCTWFAGAKMHRELFDKGSLKAYAQDTEG